MNSDEYKRAFGLQGPPNSDPGKALDLAFDIRKFEIDLYWKRATYFWAFIAVAIAGYVTALGARDISCRERWDALLTSSCVGLVCAVAWYFVNRASKFWQENWERHVDLLEDAVIGPLYKTVMTDYKMSFWRLFGSYAFSVSNLNQIISLFVSLLFFLLTAATLWRFTRALGSLDPFAYAICVLTFLTLAAFGWKGRTNFTTEPISVLARTRTATVVEEVKSRPKMPESRLSPDL
jgi:hypothetical protein